MEFTQVKSDAWSTLQMNAGVILSSFTPANATIASNTILGVTTGGIQFQANPTFIDFGEDVDNCPPNTKELKKLQYYDPVISGTFIAMDTTLLQKLISATSGSNGLYTPNNQIAAADFSDLWFVGDYSDKNDTASGTTTKKAGFMAIELKNAFNSAGFQWTSQKDGKGTFSFEFHGHYSLADISTVPFNIYLQAGSATT